ncbi:hypothetical protein JOF56_003752 [Kibdelosporangium banguiense]|uniref:Uncharacterized protein n=1 Tax=Kibdelosporangium banguiense TaxID=1365924 RepID=A0ABS4TG20_9PSEU|nr:hypothetical protein [Kibdelosporangium banguiense]MBP2323367.1 hypothetical protein [Kibdelosporangium banguiense]
MSSGGARGRSGPAPDLNALRRDREGDWVILTERTGPIPTWPLSIPASPAELLHWERAWTTPQATQWEKNGMEVEVALYVRSLAEAELPGAAANLRNLVKQLQENLGLSLVGLARFRWKIADSPSATTASFTRQSPAARPARSRPSARERFKVVSPPQDA